MLFSEERCPPATAASFRDVLARELEDLAERLAVEHERWLFSSGPPGGQGRGIHPRAVATAPAPERAEAETAAPQAPAGGDADLPGLERSVEQQSRTAPVGGDADLPGLERSVEQQSNTVRFASEKSTAQQSNEEGYSDVEAPVASLPSRGRGPEGSGSEERAAYQPVAAQFVRLKVWQRSAKTLWIAKALRTSAEQLDGVDDEESEEGANAKLSTEVPSTGWGHMMVHPHRSWRVAWDLFGMVFVIYECIMLPLQLFNIPHNMFMKVMAWMIRIFWSIDLPLSFITGYCDSTGMVEMRPSRVAVHYLRTWLCMDLAMLLADWTEEFMDGSTSVNAARLGKTVKSLRLIRMARAFRIVRLYQEWVPGIAQILIATFHSELSGIVIALLRIVVFLIWLNHVIACCWFALADGELEMSTWLTVHDMVEAPVEYRYLTAFHWSLALFAGSMEIYPQNIAERGFAVVTLLFAFVIAAWVVSVITTVMTRLEVAAAQDAKKLTSLRQFLCESKISAQLALRVQRNVRYAMKEQKRTRPNIELLKLISEPLRVELHFEVHMPVLAAHPFLRNYSQVCPAVMRQVCHVAVRSMFLTRGDVLFKEGDVPPVPQMYFVSGGRFRYHRTAATFQDVGEPGSTMPTVLSFRSSASQSCSTSCAQAVRCGQWACEPVLWTSWAHCGTMLARTDSTLLSLNAAQFQQIAVSVSEGIADRYCEAFLQMLNARQQGELTDLADPGMDIEQAAFDTCPPPTNRLYRTGLRFARP